MIFKLNTIKNLVTHHASPQNFDITKLPNSPNGKFAQGFMILT